MKLSKPATTAITRPAPLPRTGFTLVEMLVSVALVMLMMVLFAEIFQIATGMMTQQRGIAENDQRARTLESIIRYDLECRTFKKVVPFFNGEVPADTTPPDFSLRQGYLYISENDPYNNADDVLQFTVDARNSSRIGAGGRAQPYFGRASLLTPDLDGNGDVINDFIRNLNQPEFDNSQVIPDGTGASEFAQISYFLRNGNLHRRVVLIRKPQYSEPESTSAGDAAQPKLRLIPDPDWSSPLPPGVPVPPNPGPPLTVFDPNSRNVNSPDSDHARYPHPALTSGPIIFQTGNFWTDFDYSAVASFHLPDALNNGVTFSNYSTDLDNSQDRVGNAYSLGFPWNRWGHCHVAPGVDGINYTGDDGEHIRDVGRPREYVDHPGLDDAIGGGDDTINGYFIGRFTQEETSHETFGYPQFASVDSGGNPINGGNPMRNFNITSNPLYGSFAGPVRQYANGDRRAEDILMTNVHAFDIKVWDPGLNGYHDIGHSNAGGEFVYDFGAAPPVTPPGPAFRRRLHDDYVYGPHPDQLRDGNANPRVNRVFDTWHPRLGLPTTGSVTDPPPYRPVRYRGPLGPVLGSSGAAAWRGVWADDSDSSKDNYVVGDIVFDPNIAAGVPVYYANFVYRCISIDANNAAGGGDFDTDGTLNPGNGDGTTSVGPVPWPTTDGSTVQDGDLIWQAIYNPIPLQSIQIRILVLDNTSNQMKQVTIVQPLKY